MHVYYVAYTKLFELFPLQSSVNWKKKDLRGDGISFSVELTKVGKLSKTSIKKKYLILKIS